MEITPVEYWTRQLIMYVSVGTTLVQEGNGVTILPNDRVAQPALLFPTPWRNRAPCRTSYVLCPALLLCSTEHYRAHRAMCIPSLASKYIGRQELTRRSCVQLK